MSKMLIDRAVVEQALEALEDLRVLHVKQSMAIFALRAELAEPQGEPQPLDQLKGLGDMLREEVDRLIAAKAGPHPQPQQAQPQEPYTGDVIRIMREAGMTFHLGLPQKAVVEQMTRVIDLVYAEASIKAAQQFAASPPQAEEPQEPVQEPVAIEWQCVPVDLTADMRNAFHGVTDDDVVAKGAAGSRWAAMLAVAPQRPAEPVQEPASKMTAGRAAYFMARFKREEKMLGPNEQAALDFVISMLEAGKRDSNGVLELSPPPRPVKPVAHVQRLGSYQGVPAYGCLLTLEAEKRMKVNDPLYGQAELEAFGAQIAVDVRMRCAQIADAHASCEGIAQVIAAEIRGQA